jgi:hypothetical protein
MRSRPLIAAWLMLMASVDVRAAQVFVFPSKDNTLFEDASGSVSGGASPALFSGRNNQELNRRALIAFDLTRISISSVVVDSVVLTLHVSTAPDFIPRSFELHRVLEDWGEGSSDGGSGGQGAAATDGDATWIHAFRPGNAWMNPGGDFDPIESAATLVGDVGFCRWSGKKMIEDVKAWLDHPATSYGWLIRGEEVGTRTTRRFDSRESPDETVRPILTIYYTPVRSTMSWRRLKNEYR